MSYIPNLSALCLKVILRNNGILGFTNCDQSFNFEGVLYQGSSMRNISKITKTSDLLDEGFNLEIKLPHHILDVFNVMDEVYDNSTISLFSLQLENADKEYRMRNSKSTKIYSGTIKSITLNEQWSTIEISSFKEFFKKIPTNIYSASCRADFCDNFCKKDKESYIMKNLVIKDIELRNRIYCSGVREYFNALNIANSGISRTDYLRILNYGHVIFHRTVLSEDMCFPVQIIAFRESLDRISIIELTKKIPTFVTLTDSFDLVCGCDKTMHMCSNTFQNAINFRGEPYLSNAA
ncbi:baseplate hub domain-containing protein [Candidatus Fokinia crypta]|uniref:Phage protein n=1 Tax=Candidatus Fokinia crypta TaxID=1920990 RepID=A0ABZ0UQA9_9RICK|nr:DUF2163 domain-containing protein [Candidatus Fokinia cryptica]WPX97852.1 Putative phage protein [Candidatus Fokinia cryptica]